MLRYVYLLSFGERQQSSFLIAGWQASRDTKPDGGRLPVAHKGQVARDHLTLAAARAAPPQHRRAQPLCIVRRRASEYTFVTPRRRALSCDLGAEMLLIMRPDKLALCRVLSITRRIFHERNAQRNRYMPPRLSTTLDDVRWFLFKPLA